MPTLLSGSQTAGHVPAAADLISDVTGVELFINAADGSAYFKDNTGNVQVIASVAAAQLASGVVGIIGGTIDGTPIGSTVPSEGTFTTVTTAKLMLPFQGLVKSRGSLGVGPATAGSDYVSPVSVGAANGIASLDSTGHIPLSQIPTSITGGLNYLGTWNAATNTPQIQSGVGTAGSFYKVSAAGTTVVDGAGAWAVGDEIVFSGTAWARISGAQSQVVSVNGLTGAVQISKETLGAASAGDNSDIRSLSGLTTALSVAQGGTGRGSLAGLLKGNGTQPVTQAVAGVDYAAAPTGTAGQLIANRGNGGFINVSVGNGLTLSNGVLSAVMPHFEGVTSVNASGGNTGLKFTGGPVLDEGVLVLDGTLSLSHGGTGATTRQQAINNLVGGVTNRTFLRGNGNSVTMGTIQVADVPLLNQDTTGTAARVTESDQPNITSVGNLSSLTVSGKTYLGSEIILGASAGADGQVLTSQGPGMAPKWTTVQANGPGTGGSTGTVTSVNINGGSSGLTFNGGPITQAGVFQLGGVLDIPFGGTGTTVASGAGAVLKQIAPVIQGPQITDGQLNNTTIGAAVANTARFTTATANTVQTTTLNVSGIATFTATSGMKIPTGTSAQRPPATQVGMMRFNTEEGNFEGLGKSGEWLILGIPAQSQLFSVVTADRLALPSDLLAVNTAFGPVTVTLPVNPLTGTAVTLVDANDFSINNLRIDGNGRKIQGSLDTLRITTKGVQLYVVYQGTEWVVYGSETSAWMPGTGKGTRVLNEQPVLIAPDLGTPVAINLSNAVGLPLTDGTTGVLPVARGGTGRTSLGTSLLKGGTTSIVSAVAGVDYAPPITVPYGYLLSGNNEGGATAITVGQGLVLDQGVLSVEQGAVQGVISFGGGTTGLVFHNQDVGLGDMTYLEGTLAPSAGGTGASGLVGLVIANGDDPMTSATPGIDYAPATTGITSELLANNGDGGFYNVQVGAGLFLANGVLTSTSGIGTVTSVEIDGGATGLTFAGGPIVDSGTLLLEGVLSPANGGTGAQNLTGLLKANGSQPTTAAEAGVDYAAAPTGIVNQLLANAGQGGLKNLTLGSGFILQGNVLHASPAGSGGQGVLSFNSRVGTIVPEAGDYDAHQITSGMTTVGDLLDTLTGNNGAQGLYTKPAKTGAVTRSVGDVLGDRVSVKDFGADATGVVDASSAFAAAFADVDVGAEIHVPQGTYSLSASVGDPSKLITWVIEGSVDTLKLVGNIRQGNVLTQNGMGTIPVLQIEGHANAGSGTHTASLITNSGTASTLRGTKTLVTSADALADIRQGEISSLALYGSRVILSPALGYTGQSSVLSLEAKGTGAGEAIDVGLVIKTTDAKVKTAFKPQGDIAVGLDLTAITGTTALRINAGQKISMTADDQHTLAYEAGGIVNRSQGQVVHQLQDNGDIMLKGKLSFTGAVTTASAGSSSGQFLTVMVGGQLYKLALLTP